MTQSFIETNAFYTDNRLFEYGKETVLCKVIVVETDKIIARFNDSFEFNRKDDLITIFSGSFHQFVGQVKIDTNEFDIKYDKSENSIIVIYKMKKINLNPVSNITLTTP